MKKVLYFAAAALFLASCGQKPTDNSAQTRLDSMSQAMETQHIIDSTNAASAENSAAPGGRRVQETRTHESRTEEHTRSYSGNAPVNNSTPAAQAPAPANYPAPAPVVSNAPVQPSAADIAAQKKADHRQELNRAAEGALIGAGAGAIGGAIAGKNDKFKKQDAAIGGGLGAVVGAGAGLLLEKRKLKKDSTNR